MPNGSLTYRFSPLSAWPGVPTPRHARKRAPFKSNYNRTIPLLERELRHLGATDVLIEADCEPSEVRRDGMLRTDARLRGSGIVLTFRSKQDGTPIRMPCDTYTEWQDNLRAIALSLEALRRVDRYGVTKRREQYAGFKALPASTTHEMTVDEACVLVARYSSIAAAFIKSDWTSARDALRVARARTHPDKAGTAMAHEFARIEEAKRVLEAAFGRSL